MVKKISKGSLLGRSSSSSKDKTGLYLVSIVGIVAVVALFLMVKGGSQTSSEEVMVVDEEGNLVGEAFMDYNVDTTQLKVAPSIQLKSGIEDSKISANLELEPVCKDLLEEDDREVFDRTLDELNNDFSDIENLENVVITYDFDIIDNKIYFREFEDLGNAMQNWIYDFNTILKDSRLDAKETMHRVKSTSVNVKHSDGSSTIMIWTKVWNLLTGTWTESLKIEDCDENDNCEGTDILSNSEGSYEFISSDEDNDFWEDPRLDGAYIISLNEIGLFDLDFSKESLALNCLFGAYH